MQSKLARLDIQAYIGSTKEICCKRDIVSSILQAMKPTETSTTPSCSGPIPAQKSRANSVPGAIFSHLMFEMNFYYFHRFSWEKYTKMIGHMPLLYQ